MTHPSDLNMTSRDRAPIEPSGAPSDMPRTNTPPTLEHHRVTSTSPDQKNLSIASTDPTQFTLPPLQALLPGEQEQAKGASNMQSHAQNPTGMAPASLSHNEHVISHATQSEGTLSEAPSVSLSANTAQPPPISTEQPCSSPTRIKQEAVATPRAASPANTNPLPGSQQSAITSLKNEQSLRTQSPLRESSVPVPSTEIPTVDDMTSMKKRPAPPRTKKGTASIMKKAPPAKKRRVEPKRSETPSSSRASKPPGLKSGSTKGTPANSSPARSIRSESADPDDEPDDEPEDGDVSDDGGTYCICRRSDTGTFMIGCDGTCDDWFHGKCVGIQERDKNLIDKYMCPNCTEARIGLSTWKRICRRRGCRQPARVGKIKGTKGVSKYCSDECGVLYFREMIAKTRGHEDIAKDRGSRRKSGMPNTRNQIGDEDLGAKGGVLAVGEVKGLMDSAKSAQDFKKLGEGVLSPPDTPDENGMSRDQDFTAVETEALSKIYSQKDDARRRHQLLKDRMKFVTMIKQASSRMATEKELKPKDYCGYDPRIEWTEAEFASWRDSTAGKRVFELETLATENNSVVDQDGDTAIEDTDEIDRNAELEICDRKKCNRHLDWGKLSVDDLRYEMSINSDHMRSLDKDEKGIKERAALRSKAGDVKGEGFAEFHVLTASSGPNDDPMDVEVEGEQAAIIMETVENTSENQLIIAT